MNSSSFVTDFSSQVVNQLHNLDELLRIKTIFMNAHVFCAMCAAQATGTKIIKNHWLCCKRINYMTLYCCSEQCHNRYHSVHHNGECTALKEKQQYELCDSFLIRF